MDFSERVIRQMLSSAHWQHCYRYFTEIVDEGDVVVITREDGPSLVMKDRETVVTVLREHFGWVDSAP